jgi:hypothetical protein
MVRRARESELLTRVCARIAEMPNALSQTEALSLYCASFL